MLSLLLLLFIGASSGQRRWCRITTNDQEGPFFEPNAPQTNNIAPGLEYLDKTVETYVYGQVLDRHCKPVSDATVNIWYAGGQSSAIKQVDNTRYTFPPDYLWYRGQRTTKKNGRYWFHATYPGVYEQRPIPHYHIKVEARGREFITQIYFKDDIPPSYEDYVRGRESQYPRVWQRSVDGTRYVVFNVVLDI